MDKNIDKQINELNKLWHYIDENVSYGELERKYPLMSSIDKNEISIIRIISEKDEVIIGEISSILKIPKSTLTSIIDRLEKKNLLVRKISKKDRRSYKLQLTENGEKVQQEHDRFEYEFYGKIIKSLDTNKDREEFLRLIKQIADNMTK